MIVLGIGDKFRGNGSAAAVLDFTASGLINDELAPIAEGQLPLAIGDLFEATLITVVKTVTVVNTDTVPREVFLYFLKAGGTDRLLMAEAMILQPGYSFHTDFEKVAVLDPSGAIVTTSVAQDISGKEDKSEKDATGGYAGLTLLKLNLKNAANTFTNFFTNATTAARTWTLPDKDGTVAMISDIATVPDAFKSLAVADLSDAATPSVLTTAETTNKCISNYKASGADHVFTMAAPHSLGNIIFVIGDEFQVDIEPVSGDNFYFNGLAMAADEHIQNTADTLGAQIVGFCVNINGSLKWMFTSSDATWVEATP